MSALDALALARAHDVTVELKGDQLRLLSRGQPPDDVLGALKAAKPEIVALVAPDASGSTGLDYWRVFNERFADRAARGVEPELARLEAFDRAVNEWLKRSFDLIDASTDSTRCAHCGKAVTQRCSRLDPMRAAGMPGCTTIASSRGARRKRRRQSNRWRPSG